MRRRGNSEGSIFKRKPDYWEGSVMVGRNEKGSPRKVYVHGKSKAEVLTKLADLKSRRDKGLFSEPDKVTFEEYGREWLKRRMQEVRERTHQGYAEDLERAFPYIGDVRLQNLKPLHIRRLLDSLLVQPLKTKRNDNKREMLSPRVVHRTFGRVKAVLDDALVHELVVRNPATGIKLKAFVQESVGRALEPREAQELLGAVEGTRFFVLFRLMLGTGLRKSEALGLKWADIDLENWSVSVRRGRVNLKGKAITSDTKNKKSKRTFPLPADLVPILKEWKAQQNGERAQAREAWVEEDWVFTNNLGECLHPTSLNFALTQAIRKTTIQGRVRVYDLRHTWGSLALRKGIPLEVVSERLGHSNSAITLKVYRHLLEDERTGYAVNLSDLFSGRATAQA